MIGSDLLDGNRLTIHRTVQTWCRVIFHLLRYLKEFLSGKRFATDDEIKEAVQGWLSSQAVDVYDLGIQKLAERYEKSSNKYENYVKNRDTCKELKKKYIFFFKNLQCFLFYK